jgi:hypothetical protein
LANEDLKLKSTEAAELEVVRVKSDRVYEVGAQDSSARASRETGAARMTEGRRRAVMVMRRILNDEVC